MTWTSLISHRSPHRRTAGRAALPEAVPPPHEHPDLAQDLRMARELQQGLLLQAVPRLPRWEIAATSLPATELGGDVYDFPALDDGWHGLMIGDVSGHGLTAALRMAVARTLFRQIAREGLDPGATLAALNRVLIDEMPHGMVTMIYLHAEMTTGTLRIANAGHTYPLIAGSDVRELEITGLPLGIDPEAEYETITTTLEPGETVLFYTDGVTEANDERERMFGDHRLRSLLLRHRWQRPRSLMATVLGAVKSWSSNGLADDLTMVVLRRRLPDLDAELRLVCAEVIGETNTAAIWSELPPSIGTPEVWREMLPQIGAIAQARCGRGASRELLSGLRLTLDDYRAPDRSCVPVT
jgi:phosphoserine phosphatase RsbU/P